MKSKERMTEHFESVISKGSNTENINVNEEVDNGATELRPTE